MPQYREVRVGVVTVWLEDCEVCKQQTEIPAYATALDQCAICARVMCEACTVRYDGAYLRPDVLTDGVVSAVFRVLCVGQTALCRLCYQLFTAHYEARLAHWLQDWQQASRATR